MKRVFTGTLLLLFLHLSHPCALAQQSASFQLTENLFNPAALPEGVTSLTSTSYQVAVSSFGEIAKGIIDVCVLSLESESWRLDAGFVATYGPAGEVSGVRMLPDRVTIRWNPEASAGTYNLYRDALNTLPGNYGSCERQDIVGETTTSTGVPPTGIGYFYLVTAENLLGEEGTKGYRSSGAERPNSAPCP